MELIEAKIIAMLGLGLSSMLVGLLPSWFSTQGRQQWPLFLSSLLCFGGGVLMATALIHMLPEIREILVTYRKFAELVLCSGFFLVYIIDEIVHFFFGSTHEHSDNQQYNSHNSNNIVTRRHSFTFHRKSGYSSTEYQPLLYGDHNQREATNCNFDLDNQPPSQLCHVAHQEPCNILPVGNVGLLVALSVHAILEGLAIGLQQSTSQVLLLVGAVASHKLVVGFCLGAELANLSNNICRHFLYILIFSSGSVLGIGFGMIITKIPKNVLEIIFPSLQGLAAGALLYVTVCEVIPRERARWHKQYHYRAAGILQLLSVMCGFSIMTCVTFFIST